MTRHKETTGNRTQRKQEKEREGDTEKKKVQERQKDRDDTVFMQAGSPSAAGKEDQDRKVLEKTNWFTVCGIKKAVPDLSTVCDHALTMLHTTPSAGKKSK